LQREDSKKLKLWLTNQYRIRRKRTPHREQSYSHAVKELSPKEQ